MGIDALNKVSICLFRVTKWRLIIIFESFYKNIFYLKMHFTIFPQQHFFVMNFLRDGERERENEKIYISYLIMVQRQRQALEVWIFLQVCVFTCYPLYHFPCLVCAIISIFSICYILHMINENLLHKRCVELFVFLWAQTGVNII